LFSVKRARFEFQNSRCHRYAWHPEWRGAIEAGKREECWHDMGALMRLRARLKGFAGDARKAKPVTDWDRAPISPSVG
jgi:hypothetical protein